MQELDSTLWPESLWQDTAIDIDDNPALSGATEADVVIVGAGFTGLSAALHLCDAGHSVIVVDRVAPGWGCSGRNGGQVNPAWKVLPEDLLRQLGKEAGTRALRMADDACDLVFNLIEQYGIQCDAIRPGYVQGNYSRSGQSFIDSWVKQWSAHDAPVESLDKQGVSNLLGTDFYQSGMIDYRGGSVQPLSYARGLAKAAKSAGAVLYDRTQVEKVERQGESWRCHTSNGCAQAKTVLWCTNGYTDSVWPGLRQAVVPASSFLVASEPLPKTISEAILPGRHAVSETAQIQTYYRVDHDGRFVMGGRGNITNLKLSGSTDWLEQRAIDMFPQLASAQWQHRWGGHPAMTMDRLPRLMQLDRNAYAGMGYNGRGLAMATMMGKQLSHAVLGGETLLPVTPLVKTPMHRFRRVGVVWHIATGLVRDSIARSMT